MLVSSIPTGGFFMFPEIQAYQKWLWRRAPHASTMRHYTIDLCLFFLWAGKTPDKVTVFDVDGFIQHCHTRQLAPATINRRLVTLFAYTRMTYLE
jgi:hypothetical protein